MSQVLRLGDRRNTELSLVCFERAELCRLLALYSSRVAEGEWRDYAINQQGGYAIFAVFRHALDSPVFTITKTGGQSLGWEVASGPRKLFRGDTLEEALSFLNAPCGS